MRLPRRRVLQLAAGACALPALARIARAQSCPTRPIRLVVPFPPGGAFDTIGRPWADRMKSLLGAVVIENIGGGGGSVGAAQAARARPDGYTLLLGGATTHITEAQLKNRPQFDPLKDLEPISGIAITAFALAVHPSVPANNLNELVAYAKANPGKLSYGSAGTGSLNRLTAAPELPTAVEQGLTDLVAPNFVGVFAPTGTPKPIIDQVAQANLALLADRDYRELLVSGTFEPHGDLGPEHTGAMWTTSWRAGPQLSRRWA